MPAVSKDDFASSSNAWTQEFVDRALRSGPATQRVLDVGGGRSPAFPPAARPAAWHYVGLDVSRGELEGAPAGSYDEIVVGDVGIRIPELVGNFDLIVSWQLFEHVKPLDRAMENLHAYLHPGGHLVAQLSGAFSFFGILGRVLPLEVTKRALARVQQRPRETVFRTHYHRCWFSALRRMTSTWAEVEIVPRWGGDAYLKFSPMLTALNERYERWADRHGHANLATHYIIDAEK